MNEVLKELSNIGIVPVIAIDDASKAVPLAKALVAGGLPTAEVTFRTAAAEDAIRAIIKEVPEMLVGAGTVLTHEQLDRALDAGCKFIVSPGFNPEMVKYGLSKGALMLPGTATGGEMEQAMALGLEVVGGGLDAFKTLGGRFDAVFAHTAVSADGESLLDHLGVGGDGKQQRSCNHQDLLHICKG